ncbi:hypothetical protein HMPREF0682_1640 [Propionibacterium acidifaciens F0233]|uniref:Uncharacterized protein n=1 Tax=Propionibacterium acidifaciens F0233 TaxID=553198 RepID=U2R2U7_9ACTN|nr:hypothetical protein HMPREF0682_1640 [Propionibacterium acidifaciens F0233]
MSDASSSSSILCSSFERGITRLLGQAFGPSIHHRVDGDPSL